MRFTKGAVRLRPRSLLEMVPLVTVVLGLAAVPAQAKPFSVVITKVACASDCRNTGLEAAGESAPDFYAKVWINGVFHETARWPDDQELVTQNMIVTEDVPDGVNDVTVSIQIWDYDSTSGDDLADASPVSDKANLDLVYHRDSNTWSGDINSPVSCATGNGEPGDLTTDPKPPVTVCLGLGSDGDGDGLLDSWEVNGYDGDGDGLIDVDLPGMGANPQRKDLFLEADYFQAADHTHAPLQTAVADVVQAFANAPVANPDGTTGIQLHVDTGPLFGSGTVTPVVGAAGVTGNYGDFGGGGDAIPETSSNTIVDFAGKGLGPAADFYALKQANFSPLRAEIFRYVIFLHQTNARAATNDCTSGLAEGIPGNDFLVSLGGVGSGARGACWGADANGFSVGNRNQQAGTLMHEFGHTLGLRHGGGDGVNNKPNYLSVMNYSFQACQVTKVPATVPSCAGSPAGIPGGCDYSRYDLADLNEILPPGLDECRGIDAGVLCLGGTDWNGDKSLNGMSCQPTATNNIGGANINGDTSSDSNGNGSQDPGEPPLYSNLTGYDDWSNLRFDFQTQGNFENGVASPVPDEPDPDTIQAARAHLAELLRSELRVDETGPADARPGDTLTYQVKTDNIGRAAALGVVLTETSPLGSVSSKDLGNVVVGQEIETTHTFHVSCTTPDGTLLTDRASATGSDMLGNAVTAQDTVATTVHAPVLRLTKTATPTVNAGDAITYTITYENVGTGAAAGVVVTDILPAGVYYSPALDLGAGPRPDTVVKNADGTRTLTWTLGGLPGSSGRHAIVFTARPTLLALVNTVYGNRATLSFQNENGCVYDALNASASTRITVVAPSQNPLTLGYWRNKPAEWNAETLARIQATDDSFEGSDGSTPDGALTDSEVTAAFAPSGTYPRVTSQQLLATYFNLATRRINAGTALVSKTDVRLGLRTVRDAAIYSQATLLLPVTSATQDRYSDTTKVLDEINSNKSERY